MIILASVILLLSSGGCDLPLSIDLNQDCVINLDDVYILAAQWLEESDVENISDRDRLDTVDFAKLLQQWGHKGGRSCSECEDWQTKHPTWIFCDDFDDGTPLRREGRYFEYDDNEQDFVVVDRYRNQCKLGHEDNLSSRRGGSGKPQAGLWSCTQ